MDFGVCVGCCYRTASFCWVYSGYLTVFCKYISCYPADCILLLSDTDEEELSRLAEAAVSGHSVIQEGDISVHLLVPYQ